MAGDLEVDVVIDLYQCAIALQKATARSPFDGLVTLGNGQCVPRLKPEGTGYGCAGTPGLRSAHLASGPSFSPWQAHAVPAKGRSG